ncbi:hypothetical protein AMST5_00062 [freshwater sediment metagenome]|uniref:Uncharacterized protein n=1 Tax=freshwater sediment metagenome TaxID=556182 RepID=A0AA48RBI1_9ZZZZ
MNTGEFNTGESITGQPRSARDSEGQDLFGQEDKPRSKGKAATKKPSTALAAEDAAFEQFYLHFPRRVNKPAARKAWTAAIKSGVDPETITNAAMRFAAQREREEPDPVRREKFTPHPSTWLNGRRWEDAPAAQPIHANGGEQPSRYHDNRPHRRMNAMELFAAKRARRDHEQ